MSDDRSALTSSNAVVLPRQDWADVTDDVLPAEDSDLLGKLNALDLGKDKEDKQEGGPQLGLHPKDETAQLVVVKGNPRLSAKSFDELGLSKELMDGVVAMGFNRPSKIQAVALPIILGVGGERQSFIGQAQSGAGKTAAFVLGMLSACTAEAYPQAICVAPTRELAIQIFQEVQKLGKFMPSVSPLLVVPEEKLPRGKVTNQLVVGTPGKMYDLVCKKRSLLVNKVKVFVLDEADHVLDHMESHTTQIKKKCPADVQSLFFSATFPETVTKFALTLVKEPFTQVLLQREEMTVEEIHQFYVRAQSNDEKFEVLCKLYDALSLGQSIIFVQTIAVAKVLTQKMTELGHAVSLLHGRGMKTTERDQVMEDFKTGRSTVLITTNVLARGIDIAAVTMVVNFDLPVDREGLPDVETYVHRIGRTGRMGNQGLAVNFCASEADMKILQKIESELPGGKVEELKNDDDLEDRLEKLVTQLQSENKAKR